jgi:ABC-type transport system involved in multi-copper enzyme maturation permease subunit
MGGILLNLCWKEYRELRWNVVALLAITLGVPLYALARDHDLGLFWVLGVLVVYSIVGGIVWGMWSAAGERANRSEAFLHTLPISPPTLGVVKLAITICAALIPVVCLAALGLLLKHYVESSLVRSANLWIVSFAAACCLIHITLTVAAFGAGQRTEILAAGVGFFVLAIWGLITVLLAASNFPGFWFLTFLGPPFILLDGEYRWGAAWSMRAGLCETGLVMLALAMFYVTRYSATIRPIVARAKARTIALAIPRGPGTMTALVWKQINESAPLVLIVLAIALLVGCAFGVTIAINEYRSGAAGRLAEHNVLVTATMATFTSFGAVAFLGGFILSLVLGVAAFASDLEPKTNTFWRSRPISISQWFWTKYCVAIASLILALGVPPFLVAILFQSSGNDVFGPDGLQFIGFSALGWFGIFSAAVVSTCIVRRPLHSGLLAFGLAAAGLGVAQWLDEGWLRAEPLQRPLLIAVVWLLASIAATLIAWWAAVRDVTAFQ